VATLSYHWETAFYESKKMSQFSLHSSKLETLSATQKKLAKQYAIAFLKRDSPWTVRLPIILCLMFAILEVVIITRVNLPHPTIEPGIDYFINLAETSVGPLLGGALGLIVRNYRLRNYMDMAIEMVG
jgi:hypothetical protein